MHRVHSLLSFTCLFSLHCLLPYLYKLVTLLLLSHRGLVGTARRARLQQLCNSPDGQTKPPKAIFPKSPRLGHNRATKCQKWPFFCKMIYAHILANNMAPGLPIDLKFGTPIDNTYSRRQPDGLHGKPAHLYFLAGNSKMSVPYVNGPRLGGT